MPADTRPFCVIPARGGSKRFPRKNVALFGGETLVGLTVRTARDAGVFARIVVSTDDEEIAAIAADRGAEVRFRDAALSGDLVTLEPVLLDAADGLAREGGEFESGAIMLPTSPLRRTADVVAAYQRFVESGADYVMTVSRYMKSPFLALGEQDGYAHLLFPELARRQPTPPVWVDTGMCYFARLEALRREKTLYGKRLVMHEVPVERALDVDEPYHLRLAALVAASQRDA